MAEIAGCARVTGKVMSEPSALPANPQPSSVPERKESLMTARVGQKAPDFTAPSYYKGTFTPVSLSEFAGKWILLCFYPGDFTFV